MSSVKKVRLVKKQTKLPKGFKKAVMKVVKKVAETKYHDYNSGSNVISTTAGIADNLVVAQGTTDLTRIGDSIRLMSFELRYFIKADPAGSVAASARIIIFQWYDNTVPVASDVLATTASSNATVSAYNMDNIRKFKTLRILYDKTHIIAPAIGGPAGVSVHKFLKGFKKDINFLAGANSPLYGSIYFLNVSDVTTNPPTYNMYNRMRYIDM